ncbi:low-density lipoprotein receptor-related protein 6 [Saccoglossus kowalevskii]|uniref:Low-density lipoprotein receptor-related protein 4 n=2 Tax=Saccoglossus kowalevskii TaxID=10224 RepID=A0ABM0M6X1_SACKO|nr:PREDICTED: low-density lipoprotein receptor-related protein 4 [Saccoglossus kowalevskii]
MDRSIVITTLLIAQFMTACVCQDTKLLYTDALNAALYFQSKLWSFSYDDDGLYQRLQAEQTVERNVLHDGVSEIKITLAYDFEDEFVFWPDIIRRTINKMSLKSGEVSVLFEGISDGVAGIEVDWVANNVYWSDADYNWIMMCDYNGTYHHTLLKTGIVEPGDIAVDAVNGMLYWADMNSDDPRIESSTLSGENRTTIIAKNNYLVYPHGLTLDHWQKRIFYTDLWLEGLFSVSVTGNVSDIRVEYVDGGLYYPYYVDLSKDYFFISEFHYQEIVVVPRNNSSVESALIYPLGDAIPLGISYFDSARQPTTSNPCSENNGGCDQLCVSATDNTHQCLCTYGYIKQEDVTSQCYKDDHLIPGHKIILANETSICVAPSHLGDLSDLSEALRCVFDVDVTSLDFDHAQETLYVYQPSENAITRARLREGESFETIVSEAGRVTDLAVDWVSDNLYWTRGKIGEVSGAIFVSRLDGLKAGMLLNSGIDDPQAIVLDPLQEYLIWADSGESARIQRTSLSGRDRVTLVDTDIITPVAMTIDYQMNRIVWADNGKYTIESIGIDGQARLLLDESTHRRTFNGIANNQDIIAWIQVEENSVVFFNHDLQRQKNVLHTSGEPKAISIYDDRLQPTNQDTNPCAISQACQPGQLCIPFRGVADCVCDLSNSSCVPAEMCPLSIPYGSLTRTCTGVVGTTCQFTCLGLFNPTTSDPITCVEGGIWDKDVDDLCALNITLENFMLVTSNDGIYYVDMTSSDYRYGLLDIPSILYCMSFDFDFEDEVLYWTDAYLEVIGTTKLDGSNVDIIVQTDIIYPDGIEVDSKRRKIYWVDSEKDQIQVIDMNGNNREILVGFDLFEPRSLVHGRRDRTLYWTDWGEDQQKIERVNIDGSDRRTLASENMTHPMGLVLDELENKLYWCDASRDVLQVMNLDGSNRREIYAFPAETACFGLELTEDYFYWSDYNNGYLHRINRHSLQDETFLPDLVIEQPTEIKIYKRPPASSPDKEPRLLYTDFQFTVASIQSNVISLDHNAKQIYNMLQDETVLDQTTLHTSPMAFNTALTYDFDDSLVFWINQALGVVYKMSLITSNVTIISDVVSQDVSGIAVDWVANKLYWSDADYNWIVMCDYDGNFVHTVLKTGFMRPLDLAVDPVNGKLYWADSSQYSNRIDSSSLAGEDVLTVAGGTEDFGWPHGLTIDFDNNRLYWTDMAREAILSIGLLGSTQQQVRVEYEEGGLYYPFFIDLNKDYFFVSEYWFSEIIVIPRTDATVEYAAKYFTLPDTPLGIKYYHESRQPRHENACGVDNGGCDQLCVSSNGGHQCLCTYDFIAAPNGKCVPDDHVMPGHQIIFATNSSICSAPTHISDIIDVTDVTKCYFDNIEVTSLDYNFREETLYVYEPADNAIKRVRLRQGEPFETVIPGAGDVTGIAIDWFSSNMYWTLGQENEIRISSLDNVYKAVLLNQDVINPQSIVVHPKKEFIFWGAGGERPCIERASLSGRDRLKIITDDILLPAAMTTDYVYERLYWADSGTGKIESVTFSGEDRVTLDDGSSFARSFVGISTLQDFIVWSYEGSESLEFYDLELEQPKTSVAITGWPRAIKVFDDRLQPKSGEVNPCFVGEPCGRDHGICAPYYGVADCICDASNNECQTDEKCQLNLPNGRFDYRCDANVGKSCNFTCDVGFRAVRGNRVTCFHGTGWNLDIDKLCELIPTTVKPTTATIKTTTLKTTKMPSQGEKQKNKGDKSNTGPMIGGIVGFIVLLIVVIGVVGFLYCRHRRGSSAIYKPDDIPVEMDKPVYFSRDDGENIHGLDNPFYSTTTQDNI